VTDRFEVRAAEPRSWPDVECLLGRGGQVKNCWCMWFRLSTAERQRLWGEGTKRALRALVDAGRSPGLIAYQDDEPLGWCSVAPRSEYPLLARSPITKPVDETPVWSLVCLYVPPPHRRQGLARTLVRGACDYAASRGAEIVECYPVDDTIAKVSADAAYHGVVSLLASEGFREVARWRPSRPVMRRAVGR
jgi:GNAT superfamily N-acetyltransferase